MCGRFVFYATKDDVEEMFHVREIQSSLSSNYNVAPTEKIPVIVDDEVVDMTWGMQVDKFQVINTRAESMEKPFFKQMKHCIILANGFYEWKDKVPYYITVKNRKLFGFAGICKEGTVSIITTDANEVVKDMHERMPVIIERGKESEWLNNEKEKEINIQDISTKEEMSTLQVSNKVNSVKYKSPDCIEPERKLSDF
jgi:putative SOS response-associated peptidase YedK